jgi:hypothetical protein
MNDQVVRRARRCLSVLLGASLAFIACSRPPGSTPQGTGALHTSLSFSPADGVSSVLIDIKGPGGVVTSRSVPIPDGTPDGGPAGDAFFVLPSGLYLVSATATDAKGTPVRDCMSSSASAQVVTGKTAEITLAVFCGQPGNGGLDVVITSQHAPVISNLSFSPNKFVSVCQPVAVTVSASSPDGLTLSYGWSLTSSPLGGDGPKPEGDGLRLPPGVTSLIAPSGHSATIATATLGDYQFTVTVTDINGHSASLTFPVHVLDGEGCAPVNRSAQVTAVRDLFDLKPMTSVPAFSDISAKDPLFASVQAVAPYLHRQMLCFGCALGTKFLPNMPSTRGGTAVLLTSILAARSALTLLAPSEADGVLAAYPDGASIPPPARSVLATALESGAIVPLPGGQIGAEVIETSADLSAVLAHVSHTFMLGGAP